MTSLLRSSFARPQTARCLARLVSSLPEGGKPNSEIGAGFPDSSKEISDKPQKSVSGKPRSIEDSTSAIDCQYSHICSSLSAAYAVALAPWADGG